tara:strand:- start:258623 stop:258829 length:207 start_codon:yes stop_codon:yes gene_type:complete
MKTILTILPVNLPIGDLFCRHNPDMAKVLQEFTAFSYKDLGRYLICDHFYSAYIEGQIGASYFASPYK